MGQIPFRENKQMNGKLQPQSIEFEQSVLGAMMLEREKVDEVINILSPEHFYNDKHKLVFKCIEKLYRKNEPIDILTVTNELRESNNLEDIGGPYFIAQLTSRVASAANIVFHSRILTEKFISREIIKLSSKYNSSAYDEDDSLDLLARFENDIKALNDLTFKNKSILSIADVNKKNIDRLQQMKDGMVGISTGLNSLDDILGGWQKKKMYIIAARPGRGKTALALLACQTAAIINNIPTAIFSLEMPDEEFSSRLFSMTTTIKNSNFNRNKLDADDWANIQTASDMMYYKPLYIDDATPLTINDLKVKARQMVKKHGVELIIIDYLQLMTSSEKGLNREGVISEISRSIKSLAKELNLPIVALAQLSREIEKRGDNAEPKLSDLRESGSLEQDADAVCFIHFPNYNDDDSVLDVELIIAKHRGGKTGNTNDYSTKLPTIQFNRPYVRFENKHKF